MQLTIIHNTLPYNMTKSNSLLVAALFALSLAACQGKKSNPIPTATAQGGMPWATHLDLVCEMTVEETTPDTVHYNGKVYGFCSAHCKETFQENPSKWGAK